MESKTAKINSSEITNITSQIKKILLEIFSLLLGYPINKLCIRLSRMVIEKTLSNYFKQSTRRILGTVFGNLFGGIVCIVIASLLEKPIERLISDYIRKESENEQKRISKNTKEPIKE